MPSAISHLSSAGAENRRPMADGLRSNDPARTGWICSRAERILIVSPDPSGAADAGDRKTIAQILREAGDDLTNELVEWLNQVDAAYRTDLRELNELHFARFDAKLEQRISELRTEFAQFRGDMQAGLARLEGGLIARIGLAEARQTRLNLILWVGAVGALAALIKL